MAGTKRTHTDMETPSDTNNASPYLPIFETFKAELDTHHDRRERIIKASRDITAFSKKVIFALQRTKNIGQTPLLGHDKRAQADVAKLKQQINDTFNGVKDDLQGINAYRYSRQISSGIQEFMEAALFEHYLAEQKLLTHDEAAALFPDGIMLTHEDYALGLFDMTGELMKISITSLATQGKLPGKAGCASVLTDMQIMRTQMELVDAGHGYLGKQFEDKLRTTRQSTEKVEGSVYSMIVRGSERPKGWRPEVDIQPRGQEEVESY